MKKKTAKRVGINQKDEHDESGSLTVLVFFLRRPMSFVSYSLEVSCCTLYRSYCDAYIISLTVYLLLVYIDPTLTVALLFFSLSTSKARGSVCVWLCSMRQAVDGVLSKFQKDETTNKISLRDSQAGRARRAETFLRQYVDLWMRIKLSRDDAE